MGFYSTDLSSQESRLGGSHFDVKAVMGQSRFFTFEKDYGAENLLGFDSIDIISNQLATFEIAVDYNMEVFENVFIYGGVAYGEHRISTGIFVGDTVNNTQIFILSAQNYLFEPKSINYLGLRLGAKLRFPILKNDHLFLTLGGKGNYFLFEKTEIKESIYSDYLDENIDVDYLLSLSENKFKIAYEFGLGYSFVLNHEKYKSIIVGVQSSRSNQELLNGQYSLVTDDSNRTGIILKELGLSSTYVGFQWQF